jgi:ADP-dependent NAD(P)H-hydrate dehydratase / NAD(P)H-hydrate epimerase
MKILTAAQMQRIDRLTTGRFGVPSLTLMENAGRAVVEFLSERYAPLAERKIAILCGRGNNGGDGMVVARCLRQRGLAPRVVLFGDPATLKGDAAVNYRRLSEIAAPEIVKGSEGWERVRPSISGSTLIVDALVGTGLSKPLHGLLLEVIRDLAKDFPQARFVAVDLPSGISADGGELIGESLRVEASVTFTAPKQTHVFPPACERVGEWVVKEIGTPRELLEDDGELFLNLTEPGDVNWLAEPRRRDSHKGTYGHVLVLAGSFGKAGAAAMAARAGLRVGAGLVTVATARSVLPTVAGFGVELMTEPLPETESGGISMRALSEGHLDRLVEGKAVLAIGPGLGTAPETVELVRAVVNRYKIPIVLDADGLNAFAGCIHTLQTEGRVRVLTPHPGEMARLTGQKTSEVVAGRIDIARNFARERGCVLVLKGFRSLTALPSGQVWVNPTGNPGMATGGSGDVLTGIMAGLLAQFSSRPAGEVATAAVYLHGLAGDIAASMVGEAPLIAGDILESLPLAFRRIRGEGG